MELDLYFIAEREGKGAYCRKARRGILILSDKMNVDIVDVLSGQVYGTIKLMVDDYTGRPKVVYEDRPY